MMFPLVIVYTSLRLCLYVVRWSETVMLVYLCVFGKSMRSWRCYFSRLVRLSVRWVRLCPQRSGGKRAVALRQVWSYGKVIYNSLYFNALTNFDTVLDSIFEPIYWLVDNLTRWFGVVS